MPIISVSLMTSSLYPSQGEVMAYGAYDHFTGESCSGKSQFARYDERSLAKNGYRSEEWYANQHWKSDVLPASDALTDFLTFTKARSCVPVTSSRGKQYNTWKVATFNPMFTTDWLFGWCKKFGQFGEFDPKVIDLMALATTLNPELPDHKFDTVCRHLIPEDYEKIAQTEMWKPLSKAYLTSRLLDYYSRLWHSMAGTELPVITHVRKYMS